MIVDSSAQRALRIPLFGIVALLSVVIGVVAYERLSGRLPLGVTVGTPVAAIDLRFFDEKDGSIAVVDAGDGRVVSQLAGGTNGFVRSVMQGLVRVRLMAGRSKDAPFRLERARDGHLSLIDPAVGRRIELIGFGETNIAAFARMLPESDGGAS